MSGIRLIGKYRIITATITILLVFAVVITGVMLTARTELPFLDIDLPSDYQPGETLPPYPPRFHDYYYSAASLTGYVMLKNPSQEFIIEIDMPGRTIRHVSMWILDTRITLGDLIVRWGPPIGRHGSFIVWQDRSAFVLDKLGLFPTNKVSFVGYGTEQRDFTAWTGFSHPKLERAAVSLWQLARLIPASP